MSNEDSIEIRQENEIEALKAIFADDLQDLRGKAAWNLWSPLNLTITLTPQQGGSGVQEVHAKVDLHIVCSKKYPNEIPKIMLESSRGMSKPVLQELLTKLMEKAKELVGEVMIFELAQCTQSFLYQHNKPGFKSFYEEMLTRQKELEQQLQQAKQEEKDRERQVILNEIQQRQEILKSETRLRRERFHTENSDDNQTINSRRNYSTNRKYSNSYSSAEHEEQDDCKCERKGTQIIEFSNNGVREIQRGRCISHSHEGCVIHYNGLDIETGELFTIGEWIINTKNNDNTQMQRQISSIEQEMNYLVKLKHPNLAHYINMKHQFVSSENKIIVYILQEFVVGLNCSSFLSESFPVETDMLRHISRGVLSSLEFLHRNNVVHKEIIESCIYINSYGVVKVANYSIYKRLSDLVSQCHYLSSYNKKTDIYKFGILMLSFVRGASVSEDNMEIPSTVPLDFYDFLTKCLAKEEKERITAAQLLNHPFIRVPLERLSPQRVIDENTNVQNISPEPTVTDLKTLAQSNSLGQSRVQSEFEVLQWIGKGAFGDVLKVRNKLDGGDYAIKRIELNPKNKQLNRKITREVKLLSKLNHENVVRYYNAWIESAIIENDDADSSKTDSSNMVPNVPRVIQQKELTFKSDIEMLAPPVKDVEWSISYESKSKPVTVNDSSSDEESSDDDDDEEWGVMLNVESSDSDSIEFERDGSSAVDSEGSSELTPTTHEPVKPNSPLSRSREIQFLYIQMEFCEKSTLRTAIDASLHTDVNRIWRLFREIVEGLAHIHQQGMIHRDLKPVNIFLDLNDHVKIGDFGLATTNILHKPGDTTNASRNMQESEKEGWSHDGAGDGSLTGQVGTALYTAPELSSVTKTIYNQKVDIYSLGIILFEMCYTPLNTQMERMKVLTGLRARDIIFPLNFKEKGYDKQEILIRWLLNHDVSKRPTSQELLQSELVPPPVLEEEKLREMFRHTLNNPQFKAYKYLIASCFQQPVTLAQDITYHDTSLTVPNFAKSLPIFHYVKQTVTNIFKLHGGQNLSTPLLMPKNKYYEGTDSCVKLMTHSGSIVSVPHDLRVPFARYVAWNGITLLRRYSIERVYRENKVFGYHPRELYECAFDIVTPNTGNFMSDAELLYIMNEVINELPGLKNKNVLIRLNHTSLIKAILLHCGIKERHNDVFSLLLKAKEGKITKFDVKDLLIRLGLSDNSMDTLFHLVGLENSLTKILSTLQMITKKKSSEASVLAKQGLQDLKIIVQNAEALGVSFNIVITPGLIYNVTQYSGMMCQFVCELKKKRKRGGMDVLAAGGRYDAMIASYRNIKEQGNASNKDIRQSAVGISISLDKLIQGVQQEGGSELSNMGNLDVVVCSLGTKALIREKARVLKELWSAGIRCSLIEATNLEEIQEQCTELNVPHVVMLKDTEQGTIRIRSWERDRFQEKTASLPDLVENMQRIIKLWNEGYQEQTSSVLTTRSERTVNNYEHPHEAVVSVLFVTTEKLSSNARKRYENQIKSQLDNTFQRLSGDVMVLGLNIEDNVIRTLVSYLDFESEQIYQKSITTVVERHQRHKKYLTEICDEIYEQKSKRTNPILILYSITDSFYKIIL